MDCPIYLGAMRILFEDLGFTYRKKFDDQLHMSYHCFTSVYLNKIHANVNKIYTIEMSLNPEEIHLDRWKLKNGSTFYLVQDEIELDVCDPASVPQIVNFVNDTIALA